MHITVAPNIKQQQFYGLKTSRCDVKRKELNSYLI